MTEPRVCIVCDDPADYEITLLVYGQQVASYCLCDEHRNALDEIERPKRLQVSRVEVKIR